MSELRDLYQEVILDHGKNPRNRRAIQGGCSADGHNPLCGDRLTVYLDIEDDRIRDVAFEGSGCAISTASASMMTQAIKGLTVADARALFRRFHDLVAGPEAERDMAALGKLVVFGGVREFPVRVKCATLAWHTMQAALEGTHQAVTTE